SIITGPISEEFGWRGFLLPRLLSKNNQLKSSIILGLLWGFWHTGPDFWTFVFEGKIYALIYPVAITLGTVPLSILFTYLYIQTKGSLIPIMIFHASFNGTLYVLSLIWDSQSVYITSAELILGLWILSFFIIWKNKERWIQRGIKSF
ncbi:MAG: CPBP family intramembrane metalloprotease, partial [Bacteroidia bacterium]|nr:CPBP family intramembrane metalloprotease [Bacteroidia bacterium]